MQPARQVLRSFWGRRESILTDTTGKVSHVNLPLYHFNVTSQFACLHSKFRPPWTELDCMLIVILITVVWLSLWKKRNPQSLLLWHCDSVLALFGNHSQEKSLLKSYCSISLWLMHNIILDLKLNTEKVMSFMTFSNFLHCLCVVVLLFATSFVLMCLPLFDFNSQYLWLNM